MKLKTIDEALFEYARQELGVHSLNNHLIAFVDAHSERRHRTCIECGAQLPYRGFYVIRNAYAPIGLTRECRNCVNAKALKNQEVRQKSAKQKCGDAGMFWSPGDDAFICKHYFYATDKELAKRLGRTESEVKIHRAHDLNLKRSVTLNESLKQRNIALLNSKRLHGLAIDVETKSVRRRR